MIHAKMHETPDRVRTCSDGAFLHRQKQLSSAELDYYRRRAVEEIEAARNASCREARMAHEELAAAYRMLCTSHETKRDLRFASDPKMFRF